MSATAGSGLPVEFNVSGVCSLQGSTVTMTSGTGSCTITASQAGDVNYLPAADVVHTVQAAKVNQTITFPAPSSPAVYNTTFTINPGISSGLPLSVSASGACSLQGSTVRMTSGAGQCALTASQAGDANYNPAAVTRTVAAARANQTITFAQPASPVKQGASFTVSPQASSGLAVSLIAGGSCTAQGLKVTITAAQGVCTLTAVQTGSTNYNAAPQVVRKVTAIPNMYPVYLPLARR